MRCFPFLLYIGVFLMLRRISKLAFMVVATIAYSGFAEAQFGGLQLQIGGNGTGARIGNFSYGNGNYGGYGNGYYGGYGNGYNGGYRNGFGNSYYGNSYYGNRSRYGSYSNGFYNNGFGANPGYRYAAPRAYVTPNRSSYARRYRYR
jgi:hypothetical protein